LLAVRLTGEVYVVLGGDHFGQGFRDLDRPRSDWRWQLPPAELEEVRPSVIAVGHRQSLDLYEQIAVPVPDPIRQALIDLTT
jgi:hypothetical protein